MLSIKQIGTICLSILIPTFSAFATPDIASNANGNGSCVEPVLHRYDGTANLQAGWQANTIQLKWYNGDTQLDVQDAADSCTYDGALTLPSTQPTKTGYTFAGWRVKTGSAAASNSCFVGPVCGLTSSLAATNGSEFWSKDDEPYCRHGHGLSGCSSSEVFDFLSTHEWMVAFSHGTVKGSASCNSTMPTVYNTAMAAMQGGTMTQEQADTAVYGSCESDAIQPAGTFSSSSTGQYCWCHVESYYNGDTTACNLSSLAWVFVADGESAADCTNDCAYYCATSCASNAQRSSAFRAAVFGVSGN